MKRTFKKLLGIAALAIAVVSGNLLTASSAQAAYVAPYIPSGTGISCSKVTGGNYPYQWGTPTATGWYIYCGSNPSQFKTVAGDEVLQLNTSPNAPPLPDLRSIYKNNNVTLYVVTDVNSAALAQLVGTVPADVQQNTVAGWTKVTLTGNQTTPIVVVFERPKNASGVPTQYANDSHMNDFREVINHELGHVLDWLATTGGSSNASANMFRARIDADRIAFNARNGCANSGPDQGMWNIFGMRSQVICNGTVKAPAYANMSNLEIVYKFYPATASGWNKYFKYAPTAPVYNEIWAQLIATHKTPTGGTPPTYEELDRWMIEIYKCGRLYTNQMYNSFTYPAITCP